MNPSLPDPLANAQPLSIAGGVYRIMISGKQTNGAYAVIDMLVPPNGGPNPHAHPHFQEIFYVLEGSIEVKTDAEQYTAGKGSVVTIPMGGMVHCFKNKTDAGAHLLCVVSPAGLDEFFLEIGTPFSGDTAPASMVMDEVAKMRMKFISEKFGHLAVPPDYFD